MAILIIMMMILHITTLTAIAMFITMVDTDAPQIRAGAADVARRGGSSGGAGTITALFDIMSWMSPAWPIGGFAHSGGLEWAVEQGLVIDRVSTARWIADMLASGAIRNDATLFVYAWRAGHAADAQRVADIAELAAAAQTGHERRLEATAQGAAFRRIALSTAGESAFPTLLEEVSDDDLTYAVAAAVLFASHGIPLESALTAWLHGTVSNLVSAAQRLVPLGQTDGQRVLRDVRDAVFALVATMVALSDDADPFDALGGCTLVADLGAMAHETQYTRLFRT
jgi:urease accessory protein